MKVNKTSLLNNFILSYLCTALWSEGETGTADFTKKAKIKAKHDCQVFIDKVYAEFTKDEAVAILEYCGSDVTCLAAHDFYLTRNGHGSGFWDKEIYNELAEKGCDRLTKLANECGVVYCTKEKGRWYFD